MSRVVQYGTEVELTCYYKGRKAECMEQKTYKLNTIPHKIWGRTNPGRWPLQLYWTGSGIELNVSAAELYVELESHFSVCENWVDVLLDGALVQHFMLPEGRNRICIFRAMDPAVPHNVRILRDTQAMDEDPENVLKVHDLFTDPEGRFYEVADRPWKIEFIGDSLTSGEGLNGAYHQMDWNSGCFHATMGYPFRLAEKIHAEYRCISKSGWGVYSAFDGNREHVIPDYYEQVAGMLTGAANTAARDKWDFSLWQPDAVVVNLGSNDQNPAAKADPLDVQHAVTGFLKMLRKDNPKAWILWIYGMCGHRLEGCIEKGISEYQKECGDARVEYHSLPECSEGEMAAREHPGVAAHEEVAERLQKILKNRLQAEKVPTLTLSRFLSRGAVLEHKKPIHIWGHAAAGVEVTAVFDHMTETTTARENGRFDLEFPVHTAGGPYELVVFDSYGNRVNVKDIMVGAVWYCSGQSNMDLMMERVRDSYPDVLAQCTDDGIRAFKLATSVNYHGPLEEPESGQWEKAEPNTILSFSATAYFFARKLREKTGLPVGIVHASLGGSRIHGWLSREMLEGYDELLAEADRYQDDAYLAGRIRKNEEQSQAWHRALDVRDKGMQKAWQNGLDDADAGEIQLPAVFEDTKLRGFTGSLWFEKKFTVPAAMAGQPAHLWMGTMVDSDTMYINGQKVGETGYQYPPRKYLVPEALLHAGENALVVRLIVENGQGRWTPGKGYFLFNDQGVIDLSGSWKYKIGAVSESIPETDFVNWKATGLYNAMCAPCSEFPVEGIVWYQGEENAPLPWDYLDLTKRQIHGYRKLWKDETLPYLFVQLPNFTEDLRKLPGKWPALRECQRRAAEEEANTGMIVSMDLGEDNDLHPHGKKRIGERLAAQALHMVYGMDGEYTGPQPSEISVREDGTGSVIEIMLTHADGLYAASFDKGSELHDFMIEDRSGQLHEGKAVLEEHKVKLCINVKAQEIREIRYLYQDTNHGAMIYNSAGYPMGPFVWRR